MLVIATYANPVKYVPDVLGNRQQKDPFWVLIEPCSAIEFDNMTSAGPEVKDGVTKTLLLHRVKEVHGLVLSRDDGLKLTPSDGASLLDAFEKSRLDTKKKNAIEADLVRAILDHSHLSEGELDRFVSQSE